MNFLLNIIRDVYNQFFNVHLKRIASKNSSNDIIIDLTCVYLLNVTFAIVTIVVERNYRTTNTMI